MLKISQNKTVSLVSFFILLFGVYPLIPNRIEGLSVILLSLISMIYFIIDFKRKKYTKEFFITSLLYVIILISFLLSKNKVNGSKYIETMLSLIVLPITFYLFLGKASINFSRIKNTFFKVFFISNLIYCVISVFLFYNFNNPRYPVKDANFYRMAIAENSIIGEHPIYISIFLSLAIIVGLTLYDKNKVKSWKNIFLALGHLFLITILLLLMSKSVILALFVALIVLLLKRKRVHLKWVLYSIIVLASIIMLVPKKNNRFLEVFNVSSYKKLDNYNSTSIRVSVYNCAVEVLKNSPILGYGIGDVQGVLDDCYESREYGFTRGMYNSHNQFLNLWLCSGAIGFVLFLLWLGYYLLRSIEFRDSTMLAILLFYCVIFMFENVLSRQSGVIFFAFMINFFLWGNKLDFKKMDKNKS